MFCEGHEGASKNSSTVFKVMRFRDRRHDSSWPDVVACETKVGSVTFLLTLFLYF